MKKLCLTMAPALLLLFLTPATAQADILAAAVRQTFPTSLSTSVTNLPLTDGGATSISFSTSTTQTVAITFNADCQVSTSGSVVAVIIYVDGVAAMGTGAGSAGSRLCDTTGLASHSRTALAVVNAGSHTVQVTGQILGSGTGKLFRTVTTVEN